MSVEQVVKLDIVPQKNPPHVRVTEYDYGVNSWVIVANLFKDGFPWEPPAGTTAAIEGTKKDGTVFRTDGHVMYWPGEPSVIFTLEDNMTDVPGAAWVKIVLTINGSKLATCGLWLDIDKAGADASAVVGGNGFEEVLNEAFREYIEEHGTAPIGSGVESVNGKSGVVMLKMSDIEDDADPINVLSLGVKNDGSADCSSIVNEATRTHELYFPAGQYLVKNPIYLEHSIYGTGASRQFTYTSPRNGSVFVSNVSDTDVGVINANSNGLDIENIHVVCSGSEYGIAIRPNQSAKSFRVSACTVSNVKSKGIYADATIRNSRLAYIDNCAVFGKKGETSVGIQIGSDTGFSYSPDCKISGCEIMSVGVGIYNHSSHLRISDTHIWCGQLDESEDYSSDWWANTVGIECHGSTTIDNCYIDTARYQVLIATILGVFIDNTTFWDDGTGVLANGEAKVIEKAATLESGTALNWGALSLVLHNAYIKCGSHYILCDTDVCLGRNISFNNVMVAGTVAPTPRIGAYPRIGVTSKTGDATITAPTGKYTEIAYFDSRYGGNCDIDFSFQSIRALITWTKSNGFQKAVKSGTAKFFYQEITHEENGNTVIDGTKVYYLNDSQSDQTCYVSYVAYPNCFMVSYRNIASNTGVIFRPESLDSVDGLTEIT